MFEKIMKWYRQGLWTEKMVHNALAKGVITEDELNKILYEPMTPTILDEDDYNPVLSTDDTIG